MGTDNVVHNQRQNVVGIREVRRKLTIGYYDVCMDGG